MQVKEIAIYPGVCLYDRYQVIRVLGQGSFGVTFEIDDRGESAVLKVLTTSYPKAVSLFKREAEVLQCLHHQGVPRVKPDGYFTWPLDCPNSLHCLVMEKIDGQNLEDWLQNNKQLHPETAITWLQQLAEILEQLHQNLYFHRDIKPANIIIRPEGQLALIDFGAVREVTATYLDKVSGGYETTKIGTRGYVAPEQSDGEAVPQSDFFALGRTFVHLLTGKHPYDLYKEPHTGRLMWHEHTSNMPSELATLIDDLMAPFPWGRPKDAREIIQRLTRIQVDRCSETPKVLTEVTQSQINKSEEQKSNQLQKLFGWLKLKLMPLKMSLLLLLGLMGLRLLWPKLCVQFNDWGVELHLANHLTLAKFAYQCCLIINPNYKKVHYNLGSLYEKQGNRDRARDRYKVALAGGVAAAYNNLARLHIMSKEYGVAINLLLTGLQLVPHDRVQVRYAFLKNIGWALLKQQRYSEAEANLRAAIDLIPDKAAAYGLLAHLLQETGDRTSAQSVWESFIKYAPNDHSPEIEAWSMIAP
jgi:serine/threonine protein kinase